jgi:hypothetical protein
VEAAWHDCATRRGRGGGHTVRPRLQHCQKKPGQALLVLDEAEVCAAVAASVEMGAVEVFVLEFWWVIAVALDDVAELGKASGEELFVHGLVAVRTNAQLAFDR